MQNIIHMNNIFNESENGYKSPKAGWLETSQDEGQSPPISTSGEAWHSNSCGKPRIGNTIRHA